MSNVHPSSKGLRELAAFLDKCADEGVNVQPALFVYFNANIMAGVEQEQAVCTALCERLSQTVTVPADKYMDAKVSASFDGLSVDFMFHKNAVCVEVDQPATVKVWQARTLTAATPEAKP